MSPWLNIYVDGVIYLSIYQSVIHLKEGSQDKARRHTLMHAHVHIHSYRLVPRLPEEKRSAPNTTHQVSHVNVAKGGDCIHNGF